MKLPTQVLRPEDALIQLMFHFTILIEYQLMDLQHTMRTAVGRMNCAVSELDSYIGVASRDAAQYIENAGRDVSSENQASEAMVRRMSVLSKEVLPQIYTLVECMSFEDIQSQRLDHLVEGYKLLNEGIMAFIQRGLHRCSVEEVESFAQDIQKKVRSLYSMMEERHIFDEVFQDQAPKSSSAKD